MCVCVCELRAQIFTSFGFNMHSDSSEIPSMFLMKTNPCRPVLIPKLIEMCAIWSKIDLKEKTPKIFAFGYWASFHLIKTAVCGRKIRISFEKGQ